MGGNLEKGGKKDGSVPSTQRKFFAFVKMCERSCVCTSARVRVATKASEPELKHRQSMCFNGDYVLTAAPAHVINYSLATTPELSSGFCYYHKPMVSCCFKRQWRGEKV